MDVAELRRAAVAALEGLNSAAWHSDPVATSLRGRTLTGGTHVDTLDAFARVNGR